MEKYDEYKTSEYNWLGDLPRNWTTPWGNYVFKLFNEKSKKGEETLLTVSEHHGIKKRSEHKVTMFMAQSYEGYKTCFPGDLVINSLWAWSRGLGFSEYHGLVSTAYSVYRPDHDKYDYKYLHYLLRTERYVSQYLIASKGIWISRLILSDWAFLRIPIVSPPKPTQTAIATFLDRKTAQIDRAIAQKERLIALLRERKQIVIQQAVTKGLDPTVKMKDSGVEWIGEVPEGWEVKKLKYIASIKGGFAFSGNDFVDEGIQLIKIANTYNNALSLERQPTFLSPSFLKSHRQWIVTKGDILMSLTGTLGKRDYGFAILLESTEQYLLNQRVAKITAKPGVAVQYLLLILRNKRYLDKLYTLPSGTKQANLSNEDITGIEVVVPPLDEQIKIVEKVNADQDLIAQSIHLHTQQIAKLKEYRTVLIDAAVTGKIRVGK